MWNHFKITPFVQSVPNLAEMLNCFRLWAVEGNVWLKYTALDPFIKVYFSRYRMLPVEPNEQNRLSID